MMVQLPPSLITQILILSYLSSCSGFSTSAIIRSSVAATGRSPNNHVSLQAINAAISDLNAEESSSGDESLQRGMEDAFKSLDALSLIDWDDKERGDNSEDEVHKIKLKYRQTDNTGAADTGKATREEVEYYLEMSTELDGTSAMPRAERDDDEDIEKEDDVEPKPSIDIDSDDLLEDSDVIDQYPWESINPILRLRGPVATGYGRGGKKLGVPTANLPSSLFQSALEDMETGVYFGWSVIEQSPSQVQKQGRNGPIKAVVNVGYSPTFEGNENKEKIVEAHLITRNSPMEAFDEATISGDIVLDQAGESYIVNEIEGDFYNETIRLQLIGFLRPEQKFDSFPALIAQIHRDIGTADFALNCMPFIFSKEDGFIQDGANWIGSGGGDDIASWEFETW
jgi:riboflavin kinase